MQNQGWTPKRSDMTKDLACTLIINLMEEKGIEFHINFDEAQNIADKLITSLEKEGVNFHFQSEIEKMSEEDIDAWMEDNKELFDDLVAKGD